MSPGREAALSSRSLSVLREWERGASSWSSYAPHSAIMKVPVVGAVSPNKSLQRSGGRWYLVCASMAGIDKVPMISLGEPPGAELSCWAT